MFEDTKSTYLMLKKIVTKENPCVDNAQLKVLYAFAILFCWKSCDLSKDENLQRALLITGLGGSGKSVLIN